MKKRFFFAGFTLIETLTAVVVLALILGIFIHSLATLLQADKKVRESFEASLLLDRLLFDVKASDNFEPFEQKPDGKFEKLSLIPGDAFYRLSSDIIAESKNQWKVIGIYRRVEARVDWRLKRQFLNASTVTRERPL